MNIYGTRVIIWDTTLRIAVVFHSSDHARASQRPVMLTSTTSTLLGNSLVSIAMERRGIMQVNIEGAHDGIKPPSHMALARRPHGKKFALLAALQARSCAWNYFGLPDVFAAISCPRDPPGKLAAGPLVPAFSLRCAPASSRASVVPLLLSTPAQQQYSRSPLVWLGPRGGAHAAMAAP